MKSIWTLIILLGVEAAAFMSPLSIRTASIHASTQQIPTRGNQENRHGKLSYFLNQSHLKKQDDEIPFHSASSSTRLQMSPSGIDELPIIYQSSVFFGIYTLLSISTVQLVYKFWHLRRHFERNAITKLYILFT